MTEEHELVIQFMDYHYNNEIDSNPGIYELAVAAHDAYGLWMNPESSNRTMHKWIWHAAAMIVAIYNEQDNEAKKA